MSKAKQETGLVTTNNKLANVNFIENRESKEFKLAAYDVFQRIEAKQSSIESAQKNLKDTAKAFGEFKRETLKEIFELRAQIASGAIQGSLI